MKKKREPAQELIIRRNKIKELYEKGYTVTDIARYFEVPPVCVRKSMSETGICQNIQNRSVPGMNIVELLEQRDADISESKYTKPEYVWKLGFWRVPEVFKNSKQFNHLEMAVQMELRTIGVNIKEVKDYLKYSQEEEILVRRTQGHPFLEEQLEVGKQLSYCGWGGKEIMEFTGLSAVRFAKINKEKKEIKKGVIKEYDKIKFVARKLFESYKNNPDMTHRQLSIDYGLSRRTVITYIQQYALATGEEIEKRYSAGRKSKGNKEKTCDFNEEKLKEVMELDENSKWVFKSGWTIEKTAEKYNITELTVQKYKNKLSGKIK